MITMAQDVLSSKKIFGVAFDKLFLLYVPEF